MEKPPPPPTAASAESNVLRRRESMDRRKAELLLEARSSRLRWIRGESSASSPRSRPGEGASVLDELAASSPLPCATEVIRSMLSPGVDGRTKATSRAGGKRLDDEIASEVERVMASDGLAWESVLGPGRPAPGRDGTSGPGEESTGGSSPEEDGIPDARLYESLLDALCTPPAADVVLSMEKFCETIRGAADVMSKPDDDGTHHGAGHGESLAKAVRGFVSKTCREIEEHDAFASLLANTENEEARGQPPSADGGDTRERLSACLESFVYSKVRPDVRRVLSNEITGDRHGNDRQHSEDTVGSAGSAATISATRTIAEREGLLDEKMRCLQFVGPAHLEISCLRRKELDGHSDGDGTEGSQSHSDIDLSYTVSKLRSLSPGASPRGLLRTILQAHRGVSASLTQSAGGTTASVGADDVLPALILAVLRARPSDLLLTLRFVEVFAPQSLLRGEAGYAYTNLCGAAHFVERLDVEGHMAEVIGLEEEEGDGRRRSVLSIDPGEFRRGLEGCRRLMKDEEEARLAGGIEAGVEDDGMCAADDDGDIRRPLPAPVRISPVDVRNAREAGETVDHDWALRRQAAAGPLPAARPGVASPSKHAPAYDDPPPLPPGFTREYSYLAADPGHVTLADLPGLLDEYRMLVRATETLLAERSSRMDGEVRRETLAERKRLERDLAGVA